MTWTIEVSPSSEGTMSVWGDGNRAHPFSKNVYKNNLSKICIKLRCNSHFQREFTACSCIFKVITLIGSNQDYYFENATACSKHTLKTTIATQL